MITQQDARKEMFALVDAAWQAGAGAIVGTVPEIRYQGAEKGTVPGADKYWVRASTQNVMTKQKGHRMPVAGLSDVVYQTDGFITLQIFAPMNSPAAYAKGELLSQLGQRMFMATETPGAVWFRNPRIREIDSDGTWYRWNVIADYQFDQVKGA